MIHLGTALKRAAQKAYARTLSGEVVNPQNMKFSVKNPYILEALPPDTVELLSTLEGKSFNKVCRLLNNPNYRKIIEKYKALFNIGFNNDEIKHLLIKSRATINALSISNVDAMAYLGMLPREIGKQFDAHGISKGSVSDQLCQLNNLLTKGIDKKRPFHTAPLRCEQGAGAGLGCGAGALSDGSFILVSGKGKQLLDNGIETVIVNDTYYSIIGDLRKRFPKVNFVRAENLIPYFNNLVK